MGEIQATYFRYTRWFITPFAYVISYHVYKMVSHFGLFDFHNY